MSFWSCAGYRRESFALSNRFYTNSLHALVEACFNISKHYLKKEKIYMRKLTPLEIADVSGGISLGAYISSIITSLTRQVTADVNSVIANIGSMTTSYIVDGFALAPVFMGIQLLDGNGNPMYSVSQANDYLTNQLGYPANFTQMVASMYLSKGYLINA
jgi:hypothetical protein